MKTPWARGSVKPHIFYRGTTWFCLRHGDGVGAGETPLAAFQAYMMVRDA